MINIIFGLIMIIGGATGSFVLIGTSSSTGLLVVGVLVFGYGIKNLMDDRA